MNDIDRIALRLSRLERANHRWRAGAVFAVLGIAAVVLMGQAAPSSNTVQAEKILVKDGTGKVRAMLGVGSDDSAGLTLVAKDGKPRVMILAETASASAGKGAAFVVLFDKDGKAIWKAP
jgi:hypothetical protein